MGAWSVVIPPTADQTNLVTNPSAELAVTGYTGITNTATRSATRSRRGAWSVSYAMASGTTDGLYFGTVSLTSGTTYTFSCDVWGANGIPYKIYFATTAGTLKASTTFTGNGDWQRISVSWAADATASHRLYVTKNSSADTSTIYVDGFLCVAASADQLYWDGDSRGFRDGDFYWTGTAHASTSVMVAGTRAGGQVVDLNTYGFYVRAALGLGLAGLMNVITPTPLIGGGVYQRTIIQPRTFALAGTVMGASLQGLQQYRRSLINAFKPDAAPTQQPVLLRYQAAAAGSAFGDPLDIPALFAGGLDGGELRGFNEELVLKFETYLPYVALEDGFEGASMGYQSSIASADYLIVNINGTWQKLGTAPNAALRSCAIDPVTGDIYVSGAFTSIGGVSATGVAKYTISTGAWSALGTGFGGASTYASAIVFGPNGYPYFTGNFTTANGVTVNSITYWNGSTFVALGGTPGLGSAGQAIAFDSSGNLYVGGGFTTAGGSAANRVAKWDGSTWSALSTGFSAGTVNALAFGPNGYLYAGGSSLNPTSVAYWNGTAWASIGGPSPVNGPAFYVGPGGLIYAGGSGVLYKWNGTQWITVYSVSASYALNRLATDKWKNIIVASRYASGPITHYDTIYNGSYANIYDYTFSANNTGNYASDYRNGTYIAVGDRTGTVTAASLTTLTNNGIATAYPTFRLTGPGTVYSLRSYTTGDVIYFSLTLHAGEIAFLDLTPGAIRFYSNFRSSLLNTILPGSNLATFRLVPGANSISLFIAGTTDGNTAAWAYWRKPHHAIDGGAN